MNDRGHLSSETYRRDRRIEPKSVKADGTPDDNDRVEIGPTALAFQEWQEAGLIIPNLPRMREQRLQRLVAAIAERDLAGVLLFDPLNIRFASDTSNMQLWNTHNPFRACFVGADGYMVMWDYKATDLLTAFNPLVRETRGGASFFYFVSGDTAADDAKRFALEIDELVRERIGSNRRLAVDKIQIHGLRALDECGFDVVDGEEVLEKTRAKKDDEEIAALECAVYACEQSMHAMERHVEPGMTENEVWAVLHAENIRRGGEWIETRIMSSGPRTNPWFQECGPRIMENNDLLAFDTDMIGCFGMCSDLSRTWVIGDGNPTEEQRRLYREAHAQIVENTEILGPGVSFRDVVFGGRPLANEFMDRRYGVKIHGVGLCDEWPAITYPIDYREGSFDYDLEPGMALCVEAYIGCVGGRDGIKLENQVVITEDGYRNLTRYPFDERLLA